MESKKNVSFSVFFQAHALTIASDAATLIHVLSATYASLILASKKKYSTITEVYKNPFFRVLCRISKQMTDYDSNAHICLFCFALYFN